LSGAESAYVVSSPLVSLSKATLQGFHCQMVLPPRVAAWPPVRRRVQNRLAERERPEPLIPDNRPVYGPLVSITPLEFVEVRRTPEERLFNSLRGSITISAMNSQ
jgi:hypothetical protein